MNGSTGRIKLPGNRDSSWRHRHQTGTGRELEAEVAGHYARWKTGMKQVMRPRQKLPALLAAGLVSLAFVLPARAMDCIVADPTGTPLNIRMSPNGKIVATARQGTRIQVFEGEEKYDDRNRAWYFVALPTSSAPDGYALAQFIRCP
jgi:hypothetical protein